MKESGKFGWCETNDHEDCIEEYRPFFIERNKIIYRDETRKCGCKCHGKKS